MYDPSRGALLLLSVCAVSVARFCKTNQIPGLPSWSECMRETGALLRRILTNEKTWINRDEPIQPTHMIGACAIGPEPATTTLENYRV